MKPVAFFAIVALFLACNPVNTRAAVVDSTQFGFTVSHVDTLPVNARSLYEMFCKDIGKWWDSDHTWSGRAENLYIQQYVGGFFGETWENGGSTRHMNVIYTDPGKILRMEGGLGPLQQFPVNGIMTLQIKQEPTNCTVSLTYTVGGYIPGGASRFATMVDQVVGLQFKRFVSYAKEKK